MSESGILVLFDSPHSTYTEHTEYVTAYIEAATSHMAPAIAHIEAATACIEAATSYTAPVTAHIDAATAHTLSTAAHTEGVQPAWGLYNLA